METSTISSGRPTTAAEEANIASQEPGGAHTQDYGANTALKPSLIVTSNQSRANYANNESTLNGAIGNMSGPTGALGLTVPKYGDTVTDGNGNKGVAMFDPNTGKPLEQNGASIPDQNKKDNTPDDNNMVTTDDGTMVDASVKGVYDSSLKNLDQGIADAKSTLQSALATMQNDPAATSAVSMIMAKYDQQIAAMKDKNRILLGSYAVNQARSGGMQYANEMSSDFMSDEQDRASKRVTDLITLETSMVLKAQESYKNGDVKAFDAASKALTNATKEKSAEINKLLMASDKALKARQNEQKIAATQAKQTITDDIRISTALGKNVANAIMESGEKDPKKVDAYIEKMAKESGISNPALLKSSVVKAQQEQSKLDLSAKNTQSMIANRGKTKAGAAKKPAATKLDTTTQKKLIGTGLSGEDVNVISQAIYQYGAQSVVDSPKLSDDAKTALESYYGITRTQ